MAEDVCNGPAAQRFRIRMTIDTCVIQFCDLNILSQSILRNALTFGNHILCYLTDIFGGVLQPSLSTVIRETTFKGRQIRFGLDTQLTFLVE